MPDEDALFNKETQTPRRPPHEEPAIHRDQSLSSIELQVLSPRTLRVTAGNVEDRTIRTPCRSTSVNHVTHTAASPVPLATPRRSSGGIGHVETERESDGAKTPAMKCGSCAICLSPLVKRDVYTIQLCRHRFHRGCLEENRKAGNAGCPYCRGTLETGLTPMATKAEREAAAAAMHQEEQRQAIRNAAARARMTMAARTRRW